MKLMAFRITALAMGMLALSASMAVSQGRAWVSGSNGDIVYTSSEGGGGYWLGSPHIWLIRPDGTNKRQLTNGNDAWPSWSSDGQKIVFARQDYQGDTFVWRIFEMNANGSAQHPLTPATPGTDPNRGDNMPRFSPDGTRIVYIKTIPNSDSARPPDAQIWVMGADGSNPHVLTDLAPTHVYAVGWSPDSHEILFMADTLDGSCQEFVACRTFYEISPTGSSLTPLPIHGGLAIGGHQFYGFAYWESFDYAPNHLAWGDASVVGSSSSRQPVPDNYTIFSATSSSATNGTETRLVGDHPSFAPDAATTGDLAFVGCVGGRLGHALEGTCNYQVSVGSVDGGPSRQLTFDTSNHYSPSWGPASHFVLPTRVLSLELPPQLGTPTIPLLIHCRGGTGRGCGFKLAIMTGGTGRKSGSMTFRSKAGTDRIVRLRLPHSVRAGTRITIQLRTTIHGHSSLSHVTSRVLQRASLSARCPAPPAQAGSPVALAGKLSDAAPVGRRVVVVATSPDGRSLVVKQTTSKGGSFAATFAPDTPGLWELQALWSGDAKHPFTASRTCALAVPTPPPAKTQLGISCPSSSAFNVPLQITGAISPAFPGARITLQYSHARKGLPTEKVTTTVTTSANGSYFDGSVAADDPGEWDVTAFYAGDAANQASTSKTCATSVG
jgi:hypothetical protein